MSSARYSHAGVVVSNRILLLGGLDEQRASLNSAEYYDPNNGESLAVSPMLQARHHFTAGISGDFVYIMGGVVLGEGGAPNRQDTSIERYSIEDNSWTKVIITFKTNFEKWWKSKIDIVRVRPFVALY